MRHQPLAATLVLAVVLQSQAGPAAQFRNGNQTILLDLPQISQRAVLTQRIGLTDVTIIYHRPQARGRKVFGDLVPYGRVWRAGANDNTIIEFTHPVMVEGRPLPPGRYGLHAIPGEQEWVVIFSKNSTSWGSFFYDPKEDALRVTVTPRAIPPKDTLTFDVTELAQDSAVVTMEWDRVSVPIAMTVATKEITLAALRNQLRHLPGYKAEAWYEAAMYCLDNEFNYDEALRWIDRAIENEARFENLDLKSQLLERMGRTEEAAATHARAIALASPQQKYLYGDRLLRAGKIEEAERVFREVTRANPEAFLHWYGLARIQAQRGDREGARKSLEQALAQAPTAQGKAGMKRMLERLAAGQTIGG